MCLSANRAAESGRCSVARGDGGAVVPHAHGRQVAHAPARVADAQEQVLLLLVEEEAGIEAADGVERVPRDQARRARHPGGVGRLVAPPVVAVAGGLRDARAEAVQLAVVARVDLARRGHELRADGLHVAAERREQPLDRARLDEARVGVEQQQRRRVVPLRQHVVAGAEAEVALAVHELDLGVPGGELGQVVAGRVVEHQHRASAAATSASTVGRHASRCRRVR